MSTCFIYVKKESIDTASDFYDEQVIRRSIFDEIVILSLPEGIVNIEKVNPRKHTIY